MVGLRARTGLLVLGLATNGCSGQVFHGPAALSEMATADRQPGETDADYSKRLDGMKERGVVYYPDITLLKVTTTRKKDGDSCTTTTSNDIVLVKDKLHPQHVWYEHGFLETYKLAVALNANGGLSSVNEESTPDKGETFKNVATGLSSFVSAIAPTGAVHGFAPGAPSGEKPPPKKAECVESTQTQLYQLDTSAPIKPRRVDDIR